MFSSKILGIMEGLIPRNLAILASKDLIPWNLEILIARGLIPRRLGILTTKGIVLSPKEFGILTT